MEIQIQRGREGKEGQEGRPVRTLEQLGALCSWGLSAPLAWCAVRSQASLTDVEENPSSLSRSRRAVPYTTSLMPGNPPEPDRRTEEHSVWLVKKEWKVLWRLSLGSVKDFFSLVRMKVFFLERKSIL